MKTLLRRLLGSTKQARIDGLALERDQLRYGKDLLFGVVVEMDADATETELELRASLKHWRDRHAGLHDASNKLVARVTELNADKARLKAMAEQGDALLNREIDRLNNENDQINHRLATLVFENERLKATLDSKTEYGKLQAVESERRRLRVLSICDALDAVVATASETNAEINKEREAHKVELAEAEQEADGLNDYFDNIDKDISEALEKIGAFPGKPAGAADRIDVACARLVELKGERDVARAACDTWERRASSLIEENERLARMLSEPEFLSAEIKRRGEQMVADATCKHWSARLMTQSFADSLGDAPNAVELKISDPDHGAFIVTIQRASGKSPVDQLNEAKEKYQNLVDETSHLDQVARDQSDKIATLEIAREASAELEQQWKAERKRLHRCIRRTRERASHESFISAQLLGNLRQENVRLNTESEHVKNTCQELRTRGDDLYVALHDLIRLNMAFAEAGSDPHDATPAPVIIRARLDAALAFRQADHFIKLYAPNKENACNA